MSENKRMVSPLTTINLQALEGELVRQSAVRFKNLLQKEVELAIEAASREFQETTRNLLQKYVAELTGQLINTVQVSFQLKDDAAPGLQLQVTFPKITCVEGKDNE